MNSRITILRLVTVATLALSVPACGFWPTYHPLTAAQLADLGTHRYPGVTRDKATDACATALATLGYNVTVKEPGTGVIKTAPKTISVSSSGSAYGHSMSASVTEDGLAWSVSVEQSGDDAVVHATPRGFRNGSEMHEDNMWVAEAIDGKFKDLWTEVDGAIGAKTAPAAK
jgi:hypothetical protein